MDLGIKRTDEDYNLGVCFKSSLLLLLLLLLLFTIKMNKYSNFSHHLNSQFSKHTLELFTVEVSVVRFT